MSLWVVVVSLPQETSLHVLGGRTAVHSQESERPREDRSTDAVQLVVCPFNLFT
jgi:hypothetical protein